MYVYCSQICVSREPRDSALHLKYSGSNIDNQNFKRHCHCKYFLGQLNHNCWLGLVYRLLIFNLCNNFQLVTQFAPDFREQIFSFPSLSMRLAVSYMAFDMLKYVSSIPTLLRVFLFFLIFQKLFSVSRGNRMIWSFVLLIRCTMLIDLWMLNHPCISEMNSTLSRYMILLMYCWIKFPNDLLKFFAAMFIRDISLKLSFL